MTVLGTGNTAKVYCLNWIAERLEDYDGEFSIIDLGCGTGLGFIPLLRRFPSVRYVGIEPREESASQAIENLKEFNAEIIQMYGYDVANVLEKQFDVVISFSTLEHVYRREAYLHSTKALLKPQGHILINYDAGHFVIPTRRDKVKNAVGPILAQLGIERYYQSFVREGEFLTLIDRVGLQIVDAKFFNSRLKGINKVIPESSREGFIEHWLNVELWLNEQGLEYHDGLAGSFLTRNFILTHR